MLGHVIGDALGVPVEFETIEELAANPVADMRGFGAYDVFQRIGWIIFYLANAAYRWEGTP